MRKCSSARSSISATTKATTDDAAPDIDCFEAYNLTRGEREAAALEYRDIQGLTIDKLPLAFNDLGIPLPPDEVLDEIRADMEQFVYAPENPPSKFLPFEAFLTALGKCKAYRLEQHKLYPDREQVSAFAAMGGNFDRSGSLEEERLQRICDRFGLSININKFMSEFDEDGSGQIEFGEFAKLFEGNSAPLSVASLFRLLGGVDTDESLKMPLADLVLQMPFLPYEEYFAEHAHDFEGGGEDECIDVAAFATLLRIAELSPSEALEVQEKTEQMAEKEAKKKERKSSVGSQPPTTPMVGMGGGLDTTFTAVSARAGRTTSQKLERRLEKVISNHRSASKEREQSPAGQQFKTVKGSPRRRRFVSSRTRDPVTINNFFHSYTRDDSPPRSSTGFSETSVSQRLSNSPTKTVRFSEFLMRNYNPYSNALRSSLKTQAQAAAYWQSSDDKNNNYNNGGGSTFRPASTSSSPLVPHVPYQGYQTPPVQDPGGHLSSSRLASSGANGSKGRTLVYVVGPDGEKQPHWLVPADDVPFPSSTANSMERETRSIPPPAPPPPPMITGTTKVRPRTAPQHRRMEERNSSLLEESSPVRNTGNKQEKVYKNGAKENHVYAEKAPLSSTGFAMGSLQHHYGRPLQMEGPRIEDTCEQVVDVAPSFSFLKESFKAGKLHAAAVTIQRWQRSVSSRQRGAPTRYFTRLLQRIGRGYLSRRTIVEYVFQSSTQHGSLGGTSTGERTLTVSGNIVDGSVISLHEDDHPSARTHLYPSEQMGVTATEHGDEFASIPGHHGSGLRSTAQISKRIKDAFQRTREQAVKEMQRVGRGTLARKVLRERHTFSAELLELDGFMQLATMYLPRKPEQKRQSVVIQEFHHEDDSPLFPVPDIRQPVVITGDASLEKGDYAHTETGGTAANLNAEISDSGVSSVASSSPRKTQHQPHQEKHRQKKGKHSPNHHHHHSNHNDGTHGPLVHGLTGEEAVDNSQQQQQHTKKKENDSSLSPRQKKKGTHKGTVKKEQKVVAKISPKFSHSRGSASPNSLSLEKGSSRGNSFQSNNSFLQGSFTETTAKLHAPGREGDHKTEDGRSSPLKSSRSPSPVALNDSVKAENRRNSASKSDNKRGGTMSLDDGNARGTSLSSISPSNHSVASIHSNAASSRRGSTTIDHQEAKECNAPSSAVNRAKTPTVEEEKEKEVKPTTTAADRHTPEETQIIVTPSHGSSRNLYDDVPHESEEEDGSGNSNDEATDSLRDARTESESEVLGPKEVARRLLFKVFTGLLIRKKMGRVFWIRKKKKKRAAARTLKRFFRGFFVREQLALKWRWRQKDAAVAKALRTIGPVCAGYLERSKLFRTKVERLRVTEKQQQKQQEQRIVLLERVGRGFCARIAMSSISRHHHRATIRCNTSIVQRVGRGYLSRLSTSLSHAKMKRLKQRCCAAVTIQRIIRGFLARREAEARRSEQIAAEIYSAVELDY